MSHIPTEYEVETFSGTFVDVSNPDPDTITLEDVAHALSNVCRYGGHCTYFYSVAQHAVFVSKRLERQGFGRFEQLAGLHHDDAEAFLGDIPRPLKPLLGTTYSRLTDKMDAAIVRATRLPFQIDLRDADDPESEYVEAFHWPKVKTADNWSLFVEARHLLPSEGRQWWDGGQAADSWGLEPLPSRIVTPDYYLGYQSPKKSKAAFLARHHELTKEG